MFRMLRWDVSANGLGKRTSFFGSASTWEGGGGVGR